MSYKSIKTRVSVKFSSVSQLIQSFGPILPTLSSVQIEPTKNVIMSHLVVTLYWAVILGATHIRLFTESQNRLTRF